MRKFVRSIFILLFIGVAGQSHAQFTCGINLRDNRDTGCYPFPILATATQQAGTTITERVWTFSTCAGTTIYTTPAGPNPNFAYSTPPAPGCYCLEVRATNSAGQTCTARRCNIIQADTPRINATIVPTEVCLGGAITLNLNNTAGCGNMDTTRIVWGCGISDIIPGNPASVNHVYSPITCSPGTYNINIIAKNTCGCFATRTLQNAVTIVPKPVADFSVDTANVVCRNSLTSRFTAFAQVGTGITYTWFVNNFTTPLQSGPSRNFTHTFAANTNCYNVRLVVAHPTGCTDTITKTGFICVFSSPNLRITQTFDSACIAPGDSRQQCLSVSAGTPRWTITGPGGYLRNGVGNNYCFWVSAVGSYTVKVVVDNGPTCRDSIVQVNSFFTKARPVACFTISDTIHCQPTFCVNITNCTSPAQGTYSWNFGAGATPPTSNLATPPQICYTGYGRKTLTLSFTATNGCQASTTRNILHDTLRPNFTVFHSRGCGPLTTRITSTTAPGPEPITNYTWTFTGRAPLPPPQSGPLLSTINATFTTPGCYGIELAVTAGGCVSRRRIDTLCVGTKPVCSLTAFPNPKCYDRIEPVSFAFSCDSINMVIINYGDGQIQTLNTRKAIDTIRHLYQDCGVFDVWALAFKDSCASDTMKTRVTLYCPHVEFDDSVNCNVPDTVFLNNLTKEGDRYEWKFNCIPNVLTDEDPRVVLPQCDTCRVKLIAYNNATGCVDSIEKLINTACNAPADFIPPIGCSCFKPTFTNITPNASAGTTLWDLDTSNPVSAIYTGTVFTANNFCLGPGLYRMAMIYTAPGGCSDTVYKTLRSCVVTPSFTPTMTCFPDSFRFRGMAEDRYCDSQFTWLWDFGPLGSPRTSTLQNPVVSLPVGQHVVKLTVTNAQGCSGVISRTVISGTPVFAQWSFDSTLCPGIPVTITNTTTSPVTMDEMWLFPGGTPDTFIGHSPPPVTYSAEGDYNITYIVRAGTCNRVETQTVHIHTPVVGGTVSDTYLPCPSPQRFITASDTSKYVDRLTDLSTWIFYDTLRQDTLDISHAWDANEIFTQAGVYIATHCVTTDNGCQVCVVVDTIVVEGPYGTLTPTQSFACTCKDSIGYEIQTVKASKFIFIYGCNQGFEEDTILTVGIPGAPDIVNLRVGYCISDTCLPELILVDQNGCNVLMSNQRVFIDSPVVDYGYANFRVCDSGTVVFFDSTFYTLPPDTSRTVSWHWDFGDTLSTTDVSTLQNPSYYYSRPGTYLATLIVTSNYGCVDSVSKTVIVYPRPDAAFQLSDTVICDYEPVCITDLTTSVNPITSAVWNYGDGFTTTGVPPCHTYSIPLQPLYQLSLVVIDSNQCTDTANGIVRLNRSPTAGFQWQVVCENSPVPFSDNSAPGSAALDSCLYTFFVGGVVTDNRCNTGYIFPPGLHPVQFVVGDVNGCFDTIIDTVRVDPLTVLGLNPGDTTICVGNSVDYTLQGNYNSISWIPNIWLSDPASQNVRITPLNDVAYLVTAQSGVCPPAAETFVISVIPDIPLSATASPPSIPQGLTSQLNLDSLPRNGNVVQIDSIVWSPDSTLNCNNCENPVASPQFTTTYMVTVYYSENGYTCTVTDFVTVTVLNSCDSGVIFVPNMFTPNGDDINDVFLIRGTGANRINYFRIYDRWGGLVFEREGGVPNDTNWGWDGTDGFGKKLNGGVYVYIYELECFNKDIITGKGNVTIVK